VKSQSRGKIGNLVRGGGGSDTYNIYYNGQTLVLDNKSYYIDGQDILNIYAESSVLDSLTYYKKNDVLEINDNAHIIGFSNLKEINLKIPEYDFFIQSTPKYIIDHNADVSTETFDINGLLKPYEDIKTVLKNGQIISNATAKSMGYKGYN
jgi:hypothetical protein